MFKKILAGLAFCLIGLGAQAQTVITVVSQTCNVANTTCVLQGDGGQVINVNPQAATMDIDGVPYTGSITSFVTVSATNYRRVSDVTFTFTPTAELDAVYILARSGSGRGGWAWHPHWVFNSITVY